MLHRRLHHCLPLGKIMAQKSGFLFFCHTSLFVANFINPTYFASTFPFIYKLNFLHYPYYHQRLQHIFLASLLLQCKDLRRKTIVLLEPRFSTDNWLDDRKSQMKRMPLSASLLASVVFIGITLDILWDWILGQDLTIAIVYVLTFALVFMVLRL